MKKFKLDDIRIHEDDDYYIINKPAGVSTLDDRNDDVDILKLVREANPEASPCHRLDKDTSGLLVVAKHPDAYRYFATILEHREVKKIYHAVVNGVHSFDNLEANEPLYISNSKSRVDPDGKPSLTLVKTLEVFKQHTLLKAFPFTGRMHQIRVHLAHHGAPITGDAIYGGADIYLSSLKKHFNLKKGEPELPLIKRMALHAHEITFVHPNDEKEVSFEAPYPKDFAVLVKQLRKFN